MDASANLPTLPEPPASAGELVVRSGRNAGARRQLQRPLTVLGSATTCDIRLAAENIATQHCVIVHEQAGLFLRDLDSPTGTRVNGERVRTHRLVNGDVVEVGAVKLLVELGTPPTAEAPVADAVLLERERDSLRVVVAAVAAQQAGLTEEEIKLDQRAAALARQEMQLAQYLDERQQEQDEEVEQLRQERAAFEAERAAAREALSAETETQARQRSELERERQQVAKQRANAMELRRQLRKRYLRHTRAKDAELARREAALAGRQQELERDRERVRAFQERVNGELELGRRTLREDTEGFALDQQRWYEGVEMESQEQARRRAELGRQAADLAAEQRRWRDELARLKRESDGLEARVRHQREQLAAPLPESLPIAPLPLAPALLEEPSPEWPERLRELAGMLVDQRNHLAEQWTRLLATHHQWQDDRLAALAELERTSEQLDQRERDVAAAEAASLACAQETAVRRSALDGWQARLVAEEADWNARRDEAQTRLDERERLLDRRREKLYFAEEEHLRRSREELSQWEAAKARCEEARRQAGEVWRECESLRVTLAEQGRRLAGESLALERLRAEMVHQTPDAGRSEARLEKLALRECARLDEEARTVEAERANLSRLQAELEAEANRLSRLEDELLARQTEMSRQVERWERRRAAAEEADARRQEETRRLQARHAIDQRQLRQLREEIERLARGLMEETAESRNAA